MTRTGPSVTFLSTSLAYGGAENQLVQLAVRLKRRGWRTNVISITPPTAFTELLATEGVPCASLEVKNKLTSPASVHKLLGLLGRWRPQLLHTHLFHANLLGRATRPLHRLPLVSTLHSVNEGGRHRELAYRLTDKLSSATTIISQRAAEQHLRRGVVSRGRARVVPNGVDMQAFTPERAGKNVRRALGLGDAPLLLTVGRFTPAKDYPNLFRAFQHVAARRPEVVLLVVGAGELEGELRELVTSLDLAENVRFLGTRSDVPDLMNAADLYVMASAWEGLPMVLLEASACGLPVVSTNVGGVSEVVLDGKTGYLTPPHDPAALAASILKMLSLSRSSRRAMGLNARQRTAALYDFENIVTVWEELYLDVIAKGSAQQI